MDNPLLPGELAAAPLADQFAMEDIDIDAIDSRDLVPDDADPRVRNLTAAFDSPERAAQAPSKKRDKKRTPQARRNKRARDKTRRSKQKQELADLRENRDVLAREVVQANDSLATIETLLDSTLNRPPGSPPLSPVERLERVVKKMGTGRSRVG